MDLKFIINTFLIILLLHLLLKNIGVNRVINIVPQHLRESFGKNTVLTDHQKSLDFLLNIEENTLDHTKIESACIEDTKPTNELIDYVNSCAPESVKAGNYYVEDENSVNFMSNVLNVNKFYDRYDVPGNYANLTDTDLSSIHNIKKQESFPKQVSNNKPDNWNYKNELPMNGGNILGNIVGFDTLNDGYAMFNDKGKLFTEKCNNNMDCSVKQDDIRFGLGYPNAENRYT
jgi:hypothetical protein